MKALYTMACSTKSDHVGAAEGKTSEQRQRLHQDPGHEKGSQPQLCSWASRLVVTTSAKLHAGPPLHLLSA